MKLRIAAVSAVWITLGVCAVAAQAQGSPEYNACLDRTHGNPTERSVCAQAELTRQDNRLNATYERLMRHYREGDPAQDDLRAQERKWLKHRDEVCGAGRETPANECLIEQTSHRANELQSRIR